MTDIQITSVQDIGDDVLRVTATYTEPLVDSVGEQDERTVTAFGWVSATTNHYDDDAYEKRNVDEHGVEGKHLKDDANPRPMTAAEVGAYARRLVLEQHPELAGAEQTVEPTSIAFE